MSDQLSFVFLSTTDWDAPQFGSRQQLALQFIHRGHRVLFVEVPRSLHSFISDPAGTRRALKRLGRTRQIPDGPLVYTPLPVLPIYYHPLTNSFNQRLMYRYLGGVFSRTGWQIDVLWTYWPNTAVLAGRLGERLFVYHCIDDFTAVSYPLTPPGTIAGMEAEQCQKADIIFARTIGLTAAKRQWNPNTHILPGGVDTVQFDPKCVTELPAEIVSIPGPRIGFVGTLDNRIDVTLLQYCAQKLPQVAFIFVGPVKAHRVDIRPLQALPNIHFFPACPHAHVPGIIAAFDICLIPYRLNPYTEGLSPIKLYEYLAMGKPIVGTTIPYLKREQDHIYLAATAEEFLSGIQISLSSPPTPDQQTQWQDAARANSWARQANTIEQHLNALLTQPQ